MYQISLSRFIKEKEVKEGENDPEHITTRQEYLFNHLGLLKQVYMKTER